MIRYLVSLALLFASQAHADAVAETETPAYLAFDAPAQWTHLPGLSGKLAITAMEAEFFGAETSQAGVIAYGRVNQGALYITWIDSLRPIPTAALTMRGAFDSIHESPFQANLEAGAIEELSYRERSFDGVAEMTFEWTHLGNGTHNLNRAMGWIDGETGILHLAIAECVFPTQDNNEARTTCDKALASLHLAPTASITKLGQLAPPKRVGGAQGGKLEVPPLETGELSVPTATMGPAPSTPGRVLYDGRSPKEESDGSNRYLIGIGAVLLGIAAWLTTRNRESEKRDDEGESDEQETE